MRDLMQRHYSAILFVYKWMHSTRQLFSILATLNLIMNDIIIECSLSNSYRILSEYRNIEYWRTCRCYNLLAAPIKLDEMSRLGEYPDFRNAVQRGKEIAIVVKILLIAALH